MHRMLKIVCSAALTLALLAGVTACQSSPVTPTDATPAEPSATVSSQPAQSQETASQEETASEPEESEIDSAPVVSRVEQNGTVSTVVDRTRRHYNSNMSMDDNVFMDALIYTGYNIEKHRKDGMMWIYILSAQKRGMGYLSNITFGGGSTGLETNAAGMPDIAHFERGGLVCASFASYIYFNYLPHVAGIDTSALTVPEQPYNAHSFYLAAQDWIRKGYSHSIAFTASRGPEGIIFNTQEEIPIGSIIIFEDDRKHDGRGSHITVYAGYRNGLHWVYQVGTKNGPEFCAVERMLFGPDPQWPLMVVSTPSVVRTNAQLDLTVQDTDGKPVAGAAFQLKNKETGKTVNLGKTDAYGIISKSGLLYGKYDLIQTVPQGYSCDKPTKTIELTGKNNSRLAVTVTDKRLPPATVTKTNR